VGKALRYVVSPATTSAPFSALTSAHLSQLSRYLAIAHPRAPSPEPWTIRSPARPSAHHQPRFAPVCAAGNRLGSVVVLRASLLRLVYARGFARASLRAALWLRTSLRLGWAAGGFALVFALTFARLRNLSAPPFAPVCALPRRQVQG
jgi:hypothetical protein